MLVFKAVQSGFRPCPLDAEISPDSLNHSMILLAVGGEIPKFLAIAL